MPTGKMNRKLYYSVTNVRIIITNIFYLRRHADLFAESTEIQNEERSIGPVMVYYVPIAPLSVGNKDRDKPN